MPNRPGTKARNFRIPDELYEASQRLAGERGETVTEVVNRGLRAYVMSESVTLDDGTVLYRHPW